MPPITKDQQVFRKLSQLYQVLYDNRDYDGIMLDDLLKLDDVNFRVFSKKSGIDVLIDGTPLHITGYRGHNKAFDNLLNLGADFTAKNKNGDTALHREFYERFSYGQNQNTNIFENKLIDSVLTAHVKFGNAENPHSAYGLSHFHVACATNHLESVKCFLDSEVRVNESVNADSSIFPGYTPLHFAARFCGYETAKLLLEHGADIRTKDSRGLTPLHVVVFENLQLERYKSSNVPVRNTEELHKYEEENKKITRLFVDRYLTIDSTGFCQLHAVCTLNDISLTERCLKDVDVNCTVSIDSPMWSGFTALHFAIHSHDIDTVTLLLKNGANLGVEDAKGQTPLDICMEKFNPEELRHVLSVISSSKNIFFSDNKTTLSDFLDATRSLSTIEEFLRTTPRIVHLPKSCPVWPGYYLSHFLVHFSYVVGLDTVKTYLSLGDNITVQRDARGRTPLHLAFYQMKTKVLDMFFQHELVVGEVIDDDGLSHMHVACAMGEENAVQTLLSQGAKANVVYKGKTLRPKYIGSKLNFGSGIQTGSTPLHFAVAMKGNAAIIKILLDNGADVNAVNAAGITSLHELMYIETDRDCIDVRIKEMGNVLLSMRNLANVVCSEIGLSHLHVACYVNNKNAVKVLLKLGADANALTSNSDSESSRYYVSNMGGFSGHMPLHFAMKSGHVKLIKILLIGGADMLRKNSDGMTVLYYFLDNVWNRYHINSKFCLSMLAKDATLRKRAEDDCGLTLLHVASYLRDKRVIEKLLNDSRCNVNAQTHADSPIWPNDTPLHLLIRSCHGMKDLKYAVKLFLDRGADVTLKNNVGDTPVHEAWIRRYRRREFPGTLRLLLRYHKDFSVNPANEEGISHFHLACYVSNFVIVEKFLENGVDINLPIDYRNEKMSFQTPLRFMLESLADAEARLRTIDVLLKYGADVNIQDEKGLTPLHETARREPPRQLFLNKLYEAGVKVNSINIHGGTVLETLFRSKEPITNEELEFFFDHSNLFNTYNSVHGIGVISLMIYTPEYFRQNREFILKEIMNNHPNLLAVDPAGRTPIHNIVANCDTSISAIEYAVYIDKFITMGYDIDAQDSDGKTALHFAASFSNEKALLGLLNAGADINILDNGNRTALIVLLQALPRISNYIYISRDAYTQAKNKIGLHMIAMVVCDLELNSSDYEFMKSELSEERRRLYCEDFFEEFEMTKSVTIGTGSLTARDFLSETGAVASRPMMASEADRQAVNEFFESIDYKRFPQLISVLKLQYRKMLKRLRLMEEATDSVRELLGDVNGLSMPELCCRMIIRFLTNSEVERLIMSVSMKKSAS